MNNDKSAFSKKLSSAMKTTAGAIALVAIAGLTPSIAQAQERVEVGLLDCVVSGGTGFIVGSTKDLHCEYQGSDGYVEPYFGVINKYGIDVGTTDNSVIRWVVMAPTNKIGPGALAGNYGGVTAEATVGVGLGANALLGGFDQSVALQPFSVQSQEGLNFAVGVAGLELRSGQ